MALDPIRYDRESRTLRILDQLKLPHELVYMELSSVEDGYWAIKNMNTRGAPAIAIVGCLSLAVELDRKTFQTQADLTRFCSEALDKLVSARPTAVNINNARDELNAFIRIKMEQSEDGESETLKMVMIQRIEQMLQDDIESNKAMGDHGAKAMLKRCSGKEKLSVLTHCNTGSLATAGYGTALGVIRRLHELSHLSRAYCTETRPYNQGCRLTAFELVHEKIPSTLICDSMAAALMKRGDIDAVVTGADQIARNGETANKIGTYGLAVLAKHHSIPFYIAAPFTTVNVARATGESIVIEERPAHEMTHVAGVHIAADGIDVWNPAFDVTPAALIEGIITERGVFRPDELQQQL